MAFMVPGRTSAFQCGSASQCYLRGRHGHTEIDPSVFTAHKDLYPKQGPTGLCETSLLNPLALPNRLCVCGCVHVHKIRVGKVMSVCT